MKDSSFSFVTKRCSALTEDEINSASALFSNNYGSYSLSHPIPKFRGRQIRLPPSYYQRLTEKPCNYVAFAYYKERLIGQAFYVVEQSGKGKMTWVIQLVVDKAFRRRQVAKKLLFSIWGFSNDFAWGLATTNPVTIKTLESATMRKVSLSSMQKNVSYIKQASKNIEFVNEDTIEISENNSTVNSTFFVSHNDIPKLINSYGKNWIFGDLQEGYEWLAFAFKSQDLKPISKKDFEKIIAHSEKCLVDAYSRMDMKNHPWTKYARDEVDYMEQFIPMASGKDSVIVDVGCGIGRHVAELYGRGYKNVYGYDFSDRLLEDAKKDNSEIADRFLPGDFRKFYPGKKADFVICVYDVIGSFADQKQNDKIVRNIKKTLKKGGRAIVSVMNMELTENIARNKFDVYANPKSLFKLKASSVMQETGNVFNPDYYVIDTHSGAVFRKEMFTDDGYLDSEYIVRDRRYTMAEICAMFKKHGMSVLDARYVQAGRWDFSLKNTDLKAKEILLVVQK